MKSIWNETTEIPRRNSLKGNYRAEIAVIGAGLAGILTAYYLAEKGMDVIVLDANRIGSGQTGYTTAKITSQHNLIYQKLEKTMGTHLASQYAVANQKAIHDYKRLIKNKNISCHFEEADAYLYSVTESEILRREADCALRLGIPASFERETELPFPVHGAVRFAGQAHFSPLEFLEAVASGLTVFERTRVKTVEGHRIVTDKGSVVADKIVFACHYPFVNIPGFYFLKMYQEKSYVMELGPVKPLRGMYLGIDQDSWSFRSEGESLLLGHGSHRTGKKLKNNPYREMKKVGEHLYPEAKEYRRWSAQDCMTLDGVPYIGRFSAVTPDWYVATGFGKWGMTSSMVAARIITSMILGKKSPYEEVFSPQRFRPAAAASSFLSHAGWSTEGLLAGTLPHAPKCPHMGCRLVWNRADGCFECPCHGSRFDQNGKISCGPAQVNAPFID